MTRTYVCIGVFAGDHVSDARSDKRKPVAFVYGVGSNRMCQEIAKVRQERAGGQAAHVVYESLDWDVADTRYSLRA